MHATGKGVQQDFAEAVTWYRRAADQGYLEAQYNLGSMYANGRGMRQDFAEAYMWLTLAASSATSADRDKYVKARDVIARKLKADQIAEAQRRASEWRPSVPS